MNKKLFAPHRRVLFLLSAAIVSACGGGGGASSSGQSTTTTGAVVTTQPATSAASTTPATTTPNTASTTSTTTSGTAATPSGTTTSSGTAATADTPAKTTLNYGTPVSFVGADGMNQTAPAGSKVAVAPAIVVRDASGRPVPNVAVTFAVISGGGFVSEPRTQSDVSGVARVGSWTLGVTPGINQMVARSAGLPEVTFVGTGTPILRLGTITAIGSGDNQTGRVNTALPVQPSVILKDADGNPKAGVSVTFTIASGGGAVQNAKATTDATGSASTGVWTLGGALGTQTLSVSATDFSSIQMRATALPDGMPVLTREVVLSGLRFPWGLAFATDGTLFFTERYKGLSVKPVTGAARLIYAPADMLALEQCGMLGIALDPDFDTNHTLYAFMSSSKDAAPDSRIIALELDAGFTKVVKRTDIVTGITFSAGVHCGGGLRFGPDGFLYITTGDTRQGTIPQDVKKLGGKVLRVDTKGDPAPGNNPPAGGDPRIYAYGFRNPQGIDFRPGSNVPFLSEHGPGYTDEVTPLRAGGNGGWDPYCAAGSAEGADYCGYDGTRLMTDIAKFPGAMLPVWSDNGLSEGMAASSFLKGSKWLDWNGALAVGMLAGRRLEVLRLDAAGVTATSIPILNTLNIRLRTPRLAPDGSLYISTDDSPWGDEIWRLVPN